MKCNSVLDRSPPNPKTEAAAAAHKHGTNIAVSSSFRAEITRYIEQYVQMNYSAHLSSCRARHWVHVISPCSAPASDIVSLRPNGVQRPLWDAEPLWDCALPKCLISSIDRHPMVKPPLITWWTLILQTGFRRDAHLDRPTVVQSSDIIFRKESLKNLKKGNFWSPQ